VRSCDFTAQVLGFASLPLEFFLILLAMIAGYLVLVEAVKARFYAVQDRPCLPRPTHAGRHHRHVHRLAARFAGGQR
jgi:P-type Mg2+ transporter